MMVEKTPLEIIKESEYDRGIVVIEEEAKIVESLVRCWNKIVNNYENQTIQFSLMVQEIMKGYPEKTITRIITKVKNHPEYKEGPSKDRILQGIRLINERNDLIAWKDKSVEERELMSFDKKPYRKRDGTIFWEFYFQLYKCNMDPGLRLDLEKQGKEQLWSVRKLRSEINKVMEEYREPNTKRRFQKRDLIKEILIMLKDLDVQDLIMIKDVIKQEFNKKLIGYNKWKEAIEKDD